jgi:hypothetical protein
VPGRLLKWETLLASLVHLCIGLLTIYYLITRHMEQLSIFGADKIPWDQLEDVKNSAPELIVWAAPIMFFFVLVEVIVSYYQKKKYYDKKETFGSLGLGIGNVVISVLIKLALFSMSVWVYNLIPWRMEFTWWTFIPYYIIFDFFSYWAHNISQPATVLVGHPCPPSFRGTL